MEFLVEAVGVEPTSGDPGPGETTCLAHLSKPFRPRWAGVSGRFPRDFCRPARPGKHAGPSLRSMTPIGKVEGKLSPERAAF